MKNLILISVFLSFMSFNINAQTASPELISSSGEYFEAANGSLSWSIGEIITETTTASNNILTQGFQQPEFNITTIKLIPVNDIEVKVYPNPTSEYVFISSDSEDLEYQLFDINGKVLAQGNINSNEERINLQTYAVNIYFLRINSISNKFLQTYKINKK